MDLMFVAYEHPKDYESGKVPVNVSARSHVTRMQHKRARLKKVHQTSESVRKIVAEGWHRTSSTAIECDEQKSTSVESGEAEEKDTEQSSISSDAEHAPPVPIISSRTCAQNSQWYPDAIKDAYPGLIPVSEFKVNAEIASVMQYYLRFALVTAFRIKALAPHEPLQEHRQFFRVEESVQRGLADETYMYSVMSATAGRMSHNPYCGEYYAKLADMYIYKAIKGLRRLLSSPTIDGEKKLCAAFDIFHLCLAEWYRYEFDTCSIHLSFLRILVDSWYSSTVLDEDTKWFRLMLGTYDTFISLDMGKKPTFETIWRPAKLSAFELEVLCQRRASRGAQNLSEVNGQSKSLQPGFHLKEKEDRYNLSPFMEFDIRSDEARRPLEGCAVDAVNSVIAEGFIETDQHKIFSPDFSELMKRDFVPWRRMSSLCWATKSATLDEADWICQTGTAILHQLLLLQTALTTRQDRRQEATRLTLMIGIGALCSPTGWRSSKLLTRRLKSTLESLETGILFKQAYYPSIIEGELTLWILCIGLVATADDLPDQIDWFASRAIKLALHLPATTFSKIFEVMAKFLLPGIMRDSCTAQLADRLSRFGGGRVAASF